jgi:hypothetical protein
MGILDLEAGSLWETESTPLPSVYLFLVTEKSSPRLHTALYPPKRPELAQSGSTFPKIEDLGLAGALPAMPKKSALLFAIEYRKTEPASG